jgi:hypothetical protein
MLAMHATACRIAITLHLCSSLVCKACHGCANNTTLSKYNSGAAHSSAEHAEMIFLLASRARRSRSRTGRCWRITLRARD